MVDTVSPGPVHQVFPEETQANRVASFEARDSLSFHADICHSSSSVACSLDGSLLALCDEVHSRIWVLKLSANTKTSFPLPPGSDGSPCYPRQVCFDARGSQLLVTQRNPPGIQQFTLDGKHVRAIGHFDGGEEALLTAGLDGVATNGEIIVATQDAPRNQLLLFDYSTGHLLHGTGDRGDGDAQLDGPCGVAIAFDGQSVAVAESRGERLSVFTLDDARRPVFSRHILCAGSPRSIALLSPTTLAIVCCYTNRVAVMDGPRARSVAFVPSVANAAKAASFKPQCQQRLV